MSRDYGRGQEVQEVAEEEEETHRWENGNTKRNRTWPHSHSLSLLVSHSSDVSRERDAGKEGRKRKGVQIAFKGRGLSRKRREPAVHRDAPSIRGGRQNLWRARRVDTKWDTTCRPSAVIARFAGGAIQTTRALTANSIGHQCSILALSRVIFEVRIPCAPNPADTPDSAEFRVFSISIYSYQNNNTVN